MNLKNCFLFWLKIFSEKQKNNHKFEVKNELRRANKNEFELYKSDKIKNDIYHWGKKKTGFGGNN